MGHLIFIDALNEILQIHQIRTAVPVEVSRCTPRILSERGKHDIGVLTVYHLISVKVPGTDPARNSTAAGFCSDRAYLHL